MTSPLRLVLIGLGNMLRRDDGVGLWVVQHFPAHNFPGIKRVPIGIADPVALARAWDGADIAWIIDALKGPWPPGTIVRFRWRCFHQLCREHRFSTHALPLDEAMALALLLKPAPSHIAVYGVVGRDFSCGEGLSAEVKASARRLLRRLERLTTRIFASSPAEVANPNR